VTGDEPAESIDEEAGGSGRTFEPTAAAPSASAGPREQSPPAYRRNPSAGFARFDRARRPAPAKAILTTVLVVLVLFVVWNSQPVSR